MLSVRCKTASVGRRRFTTEDTAEEHILLRLDSLQFVKRAVVHDVAGIQCGGRFE
jgi:hypothetical protein